MKMNPLLYDIREQFRNGSMIIKLLIINIFVFLTVQIVLLFFFFLGLHGNNFIISFFSLPASIHELILKPWTLITYMFLHEGFMHILFNMLWFYWFGKIFLTFFSNRQLLNVYLLGGLAGAGFYIISYNIFPVFAAVLPFSKALGASAAVLAVVLAVSTYIPNYTIYLMFIGPVKLKYIAIFTVALDILSIPHGNAGGHIAHLGGAGLGFLFGYQMHMNKDITMFMDNLFRFFNNLFKSSPKYKTYNTTYKTRSNWEYNARKNANQKRIDEILDKVAQSGYDSLSKEEKEILFRSSKN
ncbi:MAG TPA: rhomboid family intramembrane serine protease [Bacteroidales bacterium]|nr:rhomboid family intramembrane serine protease [Bacteroidales bacterium]